MSFLFEGPDAKGTLTLKGDLTIQHASRLRELLLEALETTPRMFLHLEEVAEIDLSCLQVLCSAHRTAVALQKEIAITGRWPEALRVAAEESAFARGNHCRIAATATCFWKTGGIS